MIRRPPRSTLFSLHDALPILVHHAAAVRILVVDADLEGVGAGAHHQSSSRGNFGSDASVTPEISPARALMMRDRKSTRLNSSHGYISYAVFCLQNKRPGCRTA